MQEGVLEPYGAELFHMNVEQTTRLTAWWGTATILVLVIAFAIRHSQPPEQQAGAATLGLITMAAGMVVLVGSALGIREGLFKIGLVIFGFGFGFYSFGGFNLMAAMSPAPNSGAYLGLWTIAVLVSRGVGTFAGGLLRDLFLAFDLTLGLTYGLIFTLSAIGLLLAARIVSSLDIIDFVSEHEGPGGAPADVSIQL
jgi:BCD family chlorophyll transporter-like MFS transporter